MGGAEGGVGGIGACAEACTDGAEACGCNKAGTDGVKARVETGTMASGDAGARVGIEGGRRRV